MSTTIDQIQTANWQVSASTFGAVVEGADDINQSIALVLATRKGSDPFRPTFGSDIWQYVDQPITTAGPAIARAIREAVTLWVPRATIQEVSFTYQDSYGDPNGLPSGLRFDITWLPQFTGDANELSLLVSTQGLGVTTGGGSIIRILATESGDGILTETGQFIALI